MSRPPTTTTPNPKPLPLAPLLTALIWHALVLLANPNLDRRLTTKKLFTPNRRNHEQQ